MGQYYHPTILADNKRTVKAWVYSHSIKSRYKRSDGTSFETGHGSKLMEHSWLPNGFVKAFESLILNNPKRIVWAGDYAEPCKNLTTNVYRRCIDKLEVIPSERPNLKQTRFIVNHSTKQYVDKTKVPKDKDGWRVHPLPLLTCEGNGKGGGDYFIENPNIGIWARDIISVQSTKPIGFTELIPNFISDLQ